MKKMTIVSVGLVVVSMFACVSNAYSDNNLLGYPGRVIRQSGNVVGSVFTDLPETPRETVDLAGEVLTPFGHPEN